MRKGLYLKSPWSMLLIALILTIASAGQEQCTGDCGSGWNILGADMSAQDLSGSLDLNMSGPGLSEISFEFQGQPAERSLVTGNDTAAVIRLDPLDIDEALLSYTILSPPAHGNLSGEAPVLLYRPEAGFVGNDSMVIAVIDTAGRQLNITISIDVLELYHPPSVRIRSPSNGEIFTADAETYTALVPIHATSSGLVNSIEFYEGLEFLGSVDCPTDWENCPVTLVHEFDPGIYTLTARATDERLRNCSSLPVTIIVNPPEPYVEIMDPDDGAIFSSPADIEIAADVISETAVVSGVEFFSNGRRIGIDNESPYSILWEDVQPGVYNLVARANEEFGGYSAYSRPVLIVVVPQKALAKSDLALRMDSSPDPAPAGGLLNYVLTVTNLGPDSATDVTVENFLPEELALQSWKASQGEYEDGFWSVGGLTKYRSAKLVLTVQAPSDPAPGQIPNTAYVYGNEYDPDNSNNHVTTYTRLLAGNTSPG